MSPGRGRGGEQADERPPRGVIGVRDRPSGPRDTVIRAGADASAICRVRRTGRLAPDHDPAGAPLGHDTQRRAASDVGSSPLDGETVCRVVERVRSSHRGAAAPTLAGPKTATTAAYLHGRGDSSLDGRGGPTAIPHRLARPHLHHAHRPAGGHRPAARRGMDTRPVGRRSRRRHPLDSGIEVWEVSPGTDRVVDARHSAAVRHPARCAVREVLQSGVSPLRAWPTCPRVGRSGHVRQADV